MHVKMSNVRNIYRWHHMSRKKMLDRVVCSSEQFSFADEPRKWWW